MTELSADKAEIYSSHLSLNKAAHLLGVTEINNFDYKSLNSIRKLAKTLGCNEYDLMKSFNNNHNNSANSTESENGNLSDKSSEETSSLDEEPNLLNKKSDSASPSHTSDDNHNQQQLKSSTLPNDFLKSADNFKDTKTSPTSNRIFKKLSSQQKSLASSLLDIRDSIKIHHNNKKVLKDSNISNTTENKSDNKAAKDEASTAVKTFKRTIIKKRLPPRLYIKAKQHLAAERQDKLNNRITEAIVESGEISGNMLIPRSPIKDTPKREVVLIKDENYGFGFIAGSEKPLVIRFVSQDGPGKDKLLNGDEILSINGEDVQFLSREYVINLIRQSTTQLKLVVKQPTPKSNNSLLLTEDRKAFKKSISKNKNKVRFSLDTKTLEIPGKDEINEQADGEEDQTENSSPILASKDFRTTLEGTIDLDEKTAGEDMDQESDLDSETASPEVPEMAPIANTELTIDSDEPEPEVEVEVEVSKPSASPPILKVYLENSQGFKSFKYDQSTCVRDVLICLKEKLNLDLIDCYGLVVRLGNQSSVSSFVMLEETRQLYKIKEQYGSDAQFQCMLRYVFVPSTFDELLSNNEHSLNYLYEQSFKDVLLERFGNELKYEMTLHLATLSILHSYANNRSASKRFDAATDYLNKNDFFSEFGTNYELDEFLPASFLDSNILNRTDLKKLLDQNLEWFLEKNFLNRHDIKIEYLKCMNELLQFSGRIFFVNLLNETKEAFIIIGSNYGIATFLDIKSKTLLNLARFESIENIRVSRENLSMVKIDIDLFDATSGNDVFLKTLAIGFSNEDYLQFLYLLQGFLRINVFPIKRRLCPIQAIKSNNSAPESNLDVSMFIVKYPTFKPVLKNTEEIPLQDNVENNNKIDEELKASVPVDSTLNDTSNDCETITNAVSENSDNVDNSQSQVIHKSEIKFNIVNNLASLSDKTMIENAPCTSEDEIQLTEISQIEAEKKEELQESLPLIESYNFSNDENDSFEIKSPTESSHEDDKEMKDFFDDIQDLESLLKIADEKIQSLSSDKTEDDKRDASLVLQDEEDTEINGDETDSISSIEGSLREVLELAADEAEVSSTPLIHLYPQLDLQEENNELTGIKEETNTVSETETKEQSEQVQVPALICSRNKQSETEENLIYSYTPTQDATKTDQQQKQRQQEEAVVSQKEESNVQAVELSSGESVEMMKTALINRSNLRESKSKKYNELDVIDLTQIQNQSILVTPPPVQFSDNFKQNELKPNNIEAEVEIESGIESDSSNEHQSRSEQRNKPAQQSTQLSSKQADIIANSEVLTQADKQFLSKLFVDLETNNNSRNSTLQQQHRSSSSFNTGSIVPIIHSKFNNQSKSNSFCKKQLADNTDSTIPNKLISKAVSTTTANNNINQIANSGSESRVKSFVNAYSSRTSEINNQIKRSSSFRANNKAATASRSASESVNIASNGPSKRQANTNSSSSSGNSSASSSPIASNLTLSTNGSTVKSIAKTFESSTSSTNPSILPSYVKPKLFSSSNVTRLFTDEPDTTSTTRLKPRHQVRHSSTPEINNLDTNPVKCEITHINKNEQLTKKGQIVGRIQNETTATAQPVVGHCSPVSITSSSSSSSSSSSYMSSSDSQAYLNRSNSTTTVPSSSDSTVTSSSSSSRQHKSNFSPSGFSRVLNKLVDKSKAFSSENNVSQMEHTNKFELIDGYGDLQAQLPPKSGSSKPTKKRSYSYKSNSLTRLGRQHLFKINELERDKEKEALKHANSFSFVDSNKRPVLTNNIVVPPQPPQQPKAVANKTERSRSIHNSLPSRNFKMVDDIRSLFDKLTSKDRHRASVQSNSVFYANSAESVNNKNLQNLPGYLENQKLSTFKQQEEENYQQVESVCCLSKVEAAKLKLSQSFQSSADLVLKKSFPTATVSTPGTISNTEPLLKTDLDTATRTEVLGAEAETESTTSIENNRVVVLKSTKSLSYPSNPRLNKESPDSPRKGSLKKKSFTHRDSSQPGVMRSPAKAVRWKDMIEIKNCANSDCDDSETEPSFFSDLSANTETLAASSIKEDSRVVDKKKEDATKSSAGLLKSHVTSDVVVTQRKSEGTEHKFNLQPLHATGKEFEREMTERIERLSQIKTKTVVDVDETDKFYDEVHSDLDIVLYELHSTIEHVRLSSMLDKFDEIEDLRETELNQPRFEEKIADVAVICRQFVNNSKNMISSALVNEDEVRPHVRGAMNSLCSLVVECLETNYKYLYLNKKLDETRQLLIQILNLLNTFRTTLNITYLASSKQLNESNINLLMKQATNLANEISMLIKHFKQLF